MKRETVKNGFLIVAFILVCAFFGLLFGAFLGTIYGQQTEAPSDNSVALNQDQQQRLNELFKTWELASARLEAAQKEVNFINLKYKDLKRDFAEELNLTPREWSFDETTRKAFVRKQPAAPTK